MSPLASPILPDVVLAHAQEAEFLRTVRTTLVRASHVTLHDLLRADKRLVAHLDGLIVAGPDGLSLLDPMMGEAAVGTVFMLAVHAIQTRQADWLTRIVTLVGAHPEAERGLLSALGWVSAEDLQGTVRALLGSKQPAHRAWGLAACAMHRVDPGPLLVQALQDTDPLVRARAWRVAGQLGRRDLADAARHALTTAQSPLPRDAHDVGRAAAWALTLWGMGQTDLVRQTLTAPQAGQALAHPDVQRLAVIASPIEWGRDQVRALAAQAASSPAHKRRMLYLAGWVGDPQVVPWLLHHMATDLSVARLAADMFCLITGADLDRDALFSQQPEGVALGPDEDPAQEDVALDEDEGLMWPDVSKVQAWWQTHAARFLPGQRYFMGTQADAARAMQVLRRGRQRQRIMAAEYLCLLRPGSKLFPVAAPAWRQSRWLAEEEAALS